MKLEVLNLLGQRVAELANGEVEAGYHQVEWRPQSEVTSGIYFYRLEAIALENSDGRPSVPKEWLCHRLRAGVCGDEENAARALIPHRLRRLLDY